MDNNLKMLKDLFVIKADSKFADMSAEEKVQFCDQALSSETKGIVVTFNLSSSARRINNRIYTPRGQRNNVASWVQPFRKPILLHHDRTRDPIGRIMSVEYVENDQQAMRFFRSLSDFVKFKNAVETDNPKTIYKALLDNNLLTNPEWPGLGQLRARARIGDRAAIEKFLDERYLTFSAGSHSDRYVCSECESDWYTGEMCEHMPGSIVDGKPVVMITGSFYGDEASVVNEPANVYSQVQSIEFSDSVSTEKFDTQYLRIDPTTIYHVDSVISIGETMPDNNTEEQEKKMLETIDQAIAAAIAKLQDDLIEKTLAAVKATEQPAFDAAAFEETLTTKLLAAIEVKRTEDAASVEPPAQEDPAPQNDAHVCEKCADMQNDYRAALDQIESLKQELENFKNSRNALDTGNGAGQNEDNESSATPLPARIDNPSIAGNGVGTQVAFAKLGDYEKNIVNRYLDIKKNHGQQAADLYLGRKKAARHVPANFNIINFIQESD